MRARRTAGLWPTGLGDTTGAQPGASAAGPAPPGGSFPGSRPVSTSLHVRDCGASRAEVRQGSPSICPHHGSHRESPKPPECPHGPQAQTTSGRVGLGPGEAGRGPHSRSSSFRGHSGCSSPRLLREGSGCATSACTSQHRGRSWVLGLPGKDPAHPQQKVQSLPAAAAGRDRWSPGPQPALPQPAPAPCVYLPLGQGRPSKYRPDHLPLVLCSEILVAAWVMGWTLER